jgi:hypothetical protein
VAQNQVSTKKQKSSFNISKGIFLAQRGSSEIFSKKHAEIILHYPVIT